MIATKLIPLLSQRDKERFWDTTDKSSGPDGCWLWNGLLFESGYGRFHTNHNTFRAHRIAFVLSGGEFLDGSLVLHGCRNRHCVNPAHLYSGTQKQNCADKERDGTVNRGDRNGMIRHPEIPQGESNGNAKLTEQLVRHMRVLRSEHRISYGQLGRDFGISATHAMYICERRNWKHVK